jgi:hypothetical protein
MPTRESLALITGIEVLAGQIDANGGGIADGRRTQ